MMVLESMVQPSVQKKTDTRLEQLKMPPHSFEAEQSVLGGLMLDNEAWDRVAERVVAQDFYSRPHRIIFAAMSRLSEQGLPIDHDLGTIGISLALCAGFFFALTMFGRTTKINMLKAGPILFVGLIVLIIAEVILMIFAPGNTTLMIVSAIGLLLFAGMTVYDAQATRAMLEQYSAQGPEMVKKVSILCALNLYLDFVNMFMYILQLLGNRD